MRNEKDSATIAEPRRHPAHEALASFLRRSSFGARGALAALASCALFALAASILVTVFSRLRFAEVITALHDTSAAQIVAAMAFTCLSYFALTFYDLSALRQMSLRLPYRIIALGAFTSYAAAFNLGIPLVTGAAARYWIYARVGVTALQVANITVITGVTFWLGMSMVLGLGLVFGADALATLDHAPAFLHFVFGALVVAAVAAYCVWVTVERRCVHIRGYCLTLPGLWPTLLQLLVGVADLCAAAAALYMLIPEGVDLDFMGFAAIYVFACILGVVSHAPGGIGVFEAMLLHTLPGASQSGVLAALLLFRVIYYFLPFLLALALLGADEALRRWPSLRGTIAHIIETRGL